MRFLLHPAALLCEAALIAGVLFGRFEIAAIGLLGWIGVTAWLAMRQTQSETDRAAELEVSNENRARFAPIKSVCREIDDLVARNAQNPAVKVIGAEARAEADGVLRHAARLLALRDKALKSAHGLHVAKRALSDLESEQAGAGGEEQRSTLESAIEARKVEIAHYGDAEASVERIDAALKQAEAALSELKARIVVAASEPAGIGDGTSELSESLARVRSLTKSFDEAEQLVTGGMQ